MVEVRRSAFNYTDTINKMESEQTLNYCAGQLTRKRMLMDSLQRYFILERNEKYEDVGSYVFRSQKTEPNASRTYLKITVDENGSIFLTSNYTGAKLSYRHLKVSAADLSIVTDTLNNTDIYVNAYSNGGQWHESVTWQGKALNGVPEFIVQNAAKPIDITLIGKRNYRYRLSESDKKAMFRNRKKPAIDTFYRSAGKQNRFLGQQTDGKRLYTPNTSIRVCIHHQRMVPHQMAMEKEIWQRL